MNDRNKVKPNGKLTVKIIIPVLLVCIVIGIWVVKNS